MSGDYARWLENEVAMVLTFDRPAPLVCAACRKPVERTFDDDWQHTTLDDGLACTVYPVLPTRELTKGESDERA